MAFFFPEPFGDFKTIITFAMKYENTLFNQLIFYMATKQYLPMENPYASDAIHSDNLVNIEPLIRIIRNQQVILDSDLALLYGVETKRLNEQVKRNIDRFPDDFMFQLNKEEAEASRSQFATLNKRGSNIKHLPYAFTENGIAMLSSVLRSPLAIQTNIRIMRTFTSMRKMLANTMQMMQRLTRIEYQQIETDRRLDEVFRILGEKDDKPLQGLYYNGEIYDAYTFVCDLIRQAKKRIILFDNYIDDTVLTLLDKRDKNVKARIYTKQISQKIKLDIARHNAQYPPIEIEVFTDAHDRFLCIDDVVYHFGASIKDLGKKWFGFNRMEQTTDMLLARM